MPPCIDGDVLGWNAQVIIRKAHLPPVLLNAGLASPLSPCPLPGPPLEEEAGLLPGYNYQEGELPKLSLASVCGRRAAGVGSSWVARGTPTGSDTSRLPVPACLSLCCR